MLYQQYIQQLCSNQYPSQHQHHNIENSSKLTKNSENLSKYLNQQNSLSQKIEISSNQEMSSNDPITKP